MHDASGKFTRFCSIDAIEGAESLVEKATHAPSELPPFVVIKGFCTTEARDADGEIVVPAGINFGPFMRDGRITDGHPARRDNIVGEPISLSARRHPEGGEGFFLEGKLYCRIPRGRKVLEDHCGLLKSGARAGLGFSIEGVVIERDPADKRRILKSCITSVAIDPFPKNRYSRLEEIMMAMKRDGHAPDFDPDLFAEMLEEAFYKAMDRRSVKAQLAEQYTVEQLMSLAYLTRVPGMSFATAMGHVGRFQKGDLIHG